MRVRDIQDHLQTRAELLCTGHFEELAELNHLQFVEYREGIQNFVEGRANAVETFSKMGVLLAEQGVIRLEPKITSVQLVRNNCFKVLSRYSVLNAHGSIVSQSMVRHYLTKTQEGPRVAMLEYNNGPAGAI